MKNKIGEPTKRQLEQDNASSDVEAPSVEACPIPETAEAFLIQGGFGSGKTTALANQATELVESGIDTAEILVVCASPDAADRFAQLLTAACPQAAGTTIATARELQLAMLADPEARETSGRAARLLAPFEETFLMEDLKVCGTKPKRLREMVKFFYRGMTEMSDEDASWLINGEERKTFEFLGEVSSFFEGVPAPELANVCVHALSENPSLLVRAQRSYVLVDDYQLLSRASQIFVNALATKAIWVATNPADTSPAFDAYPYAEGVHEFIQANPHVQTTNLGACHRGALAAHAPTTLLEGRSDQTAERSTTGHSTSAATSGERADATTSGGEAGTITPDGKTDATTPDEEADAIAPDGEAGAITPDGKDDVTTTAAPGIVTLPCANPDEEAKSVARLVKQEVEAGCPAGEIYIVSPHRARTHAIQQALRAEGVRSEAAWDAHIIGGDIRDKDACFNARSLTALELIADPDDAVAWRCWCGYGDYLTNSNGIAAIREFATERKMGLVDALAFLADVEANDVTSAEGAANTVDAAQADAAATTVHAESPGIAANVAAESPDATGTTPAGTATAAELVATPSVSRVIEAYRAGLRMVDACRGLRGTELMDAIARTIDLPTDRHLSPLAKLTAPLLGDDDDSAVAMCRRALKRLAAPRFERDDCVHIGPAERVVGMEYQVIVYTGFLNGFVPHRSYFDRTETTPERAERMDRACRLSLARTTGEVSRRLVLSWFTECDVNAASRFSLKVKRIHVRDHRRYVLTEPSIYVDELVGGTK
jgi:DNA helicase-2/ATP-dependent DNA helicase PcrA